MKYVFMLASDKNINFETIKNIFVNNGYTELDADNFYNSKLVDVVDSPIYNLIF